MSKKTKGITVNKKARFEYNFIDQYEVGIVLSGAEVKSLRAGNANLNDAYCYFRKGELWVRSLYIKEYNMASDYEQDSRRERKLLMKKAELRRLEKKVKEKGYTLIPYRIYFSDRGMIKLEIALAQGKKIYDKRQSIKDKDMRRDMDRMKKAAY
ncbi:MAG: SsrA-binding protein SmpB [Saprospiraceae bacterium]|nr:SsrA-binding protein SmpB [Saprospiraceae bacterium]